MLKRVMVQAGILLSFAVVAHAAPQVTFDAASGVMSLSNNGAAGIAAIGIELTYDPARMNKPNVTIGSAATQAGKQLVTSSPAPGKLRVGIIGYNATTIADGALAVIQPVKQPTAAGAAAVSCHVTASTIEGTEIELDEANTPSSLNFSNL